MSVSSKRNRQLPWLSAMVLLTWACSPKVSASSAGLVGVDARDETDCGQDVGVDGPLDGEAGADFHADVGSLDVFASEDLLQDVDALDIDPKTLAWPALCLPANTTVTSVGDVGPLPVPCKSTSCAVCGAPSKCTCTGDGATPCAWAPMAPLNYPRYGTCQQV